MTQFGLNEILALFDFLNIPSIYEQFSVGIDFVISFLLFYGVSRTTLERRFPGRAGSFMCVAVSLALSIGFSLMERAMNFSLASFGPLAVFILVFVVAVVLFGLLRHLGMSHAVAVSLSFIVLYLSLRLVSPSIFDWIAGVAPWINGLLLLAFIISCGKLIFGLFKKKSVSSLAHEISAVSGQEYAKKRELAEQDEEHRFVKGEIGLTKKSLKSSEDIINHLNSIMRALDEYGASPEGRNRIASELTRIAEDEHYMSAHLAKLERMNGKLGAREVNRLEALQQEYEESKGGQKEKIKKLLLYERQKMIAEQAIQDLRKRVDMLIGGINHGLREAVNVLQHGLYPQDAKKHLEQCVAYEKQIFEQITGLKKLEKILIDLTKGEKKVEKTVNF